ncbi:MAG: M20/M25/M40 family metallo-hydrolase [Nitrospinae bacterium]|nr:M20/M25/M40 family metallo-hydrolase [Nitrospinota bacterium]
MATPEQAGAIIAENGRAIVEELAGKIGPRSLANPPSLEGAARFIEERFAELGYAVERQPYEAPGGHTVRNLIVEKTGRGKPDEIILIGAHYDTVPSTPGADDNASGVAGLLELARLLKAYENRRTIRLVAFTCEEPPYFHSRWMGSRVYAREARRRGDDIIAMVSIEMIGFFDASISQTFPVPLMSYFYPSTADFIGVVGNLSSRRLVTAVKEAMRRGGAIGVESITAVSLMPGINFSDHASFWHENYPAVMVTDTAFYRSPHYHGPSDTPETLNYEAFAEVVKGLYQAVVELDEGE